jgi:hypothetical protein
MRGFLMKSGAQKADDGVQLGSNLFRICSWPGCSAITQRDL